MDNITTPVVTAFDRNVAIDSFIFGVDLFSVADPDPGHFVSLFEVQDFGVDGGFFALNDLTLEPGVFHQISPAEIANLQYFGCLLYTSPSPRDQRGSRMPSSA